MKIGTPNTYNKKLYFYFIIVFTLFVTAVSIFQFRREKQYRIAKLESILNIYNEQVNNYISKQNHDPALLKNLIFTFPDSNLRVTLINFQGLVLYDTYVDAYTQMENHLMRPEIQESKVFGIGRSIRNSATTGKEYYYYAIKYDGYFVRTALPYTLGVIALLKTDTIFLYFMVLIFIAGILSIIYASDKFGTALKKLELFARKAGNNEPLDIGIEFPESELGAIGNQIVQIYENLKKTQDALSSEKEKLIKHLHITQEGLAIFSFDKREILANTFFIQYVNIISDKQIVWSDEIFDLPEFEPINRFVDANLVRRVSESETIRHKIRISKNNKTFNVQCIIFLDKTFELSITDVTHGEEEIKLKRELTSNIAHELKTPVSSIQGYLETIVNNKNLDEAKKNFFIERSYQQTLRLAELIGDITVLNKIDEAGSSYVYESLDVHEIVNNVIQDVQINLNQKNINVSVQLNNIQIDGNRSLIYSIFRNLMDNTISYAGVNLEIGINCYRQDNDFFYFSYFDTGIGVNEEHLARLFERFYRVDSGRSRKAGGTGLGLAIVKNSVMLHGGQISVKNRVQGGLEFFFTLSKKSNQSN